jgi:type I restriction-modification system DNA methylase subunit
MASFQERANFIWSIADLLRGDFKQSEYGRVILPFTVLRRVDCLLEPNKAEVLKTFEAIKNEKTEVVDKILNAKSGFKFFHNHSNFINLNDLLGEPDKIAENLHYYLNGFSQSVKEIFENFRFAEQIQRLDKANLLFKVVKSFAGIDLYHVDNLEMGYIFEHLIFKFAESSNETAGEHFTPREVIKLMVHLLFAEDSEIYKEGIIKSLYDPACGTGGMLSTADEYFREHNPDKSAVLKLFGQELNPESYAICKADMMIKGQDPENIKIGQFLYRRRVGKRALRLPAFQSAVWRGLEKGGKGNQKRIRQKRLWRPFWGRIAEHFRRLFVVFAAHDRQNATSRIGLPLGHCVQRFPPFYGQRGQRGEQHPQVGHRKRPARRHRGTA